MKMTLPICITLILLAITWYMLYTNGSEWYGYPATAVIASIVLIRFDFLKTVKPYYLILIILIIAASAYGIGESGNIYTEANEVEAYISVDSSLAESPVPDSIILKDQMTAFSNINFFITEKQFYKARGEELFIPIGQFRYYLKGFFTPSDSLYQIELEGSSLTANYIDNKLKDDFLNLEAVITKRYGEPDHIAPFPTIFSFKPGWVKFLRKWQIGRKSIYLSVGEQSRGSEYYVTCAIYDKPTYDRVAELSETKDQNKTLEDSRKF